MTCRAWLCPFRVLDPDPSGLLATFNAVAGDRLGEHAHLSNYARLGLEGIAATHSSDLAEFRLRLLHPIRHSHVAVHCRRGGQVLVRLLARARALVELAEAEV